MPENYILLERTELNASAASVTFANIPQTGYTDLKIVISSRTNRANAVDSLGFYFNGDATVARYSGRVLYGTGSSAASNAPSPVNDETMFTAGNSATASTFGNSELYIPNYTSSNQKSASVDSVGENNATTARMNISAILYDQTTAISSVTFIPITGTTILEGSTFSLYGIASVGTTPVIAPKAIGGNRIDNDGTYWYHTFTSSGSFVPQSGLTCDVLVVAGGGGGGGTSGNGGGGGAAGGVVYHASRSVSAMATVTIGAGGTGISNASGTAGVNSVFDTITANGGGFGAVTSTNGGTGGSGGGAGGNGSPTGGVANQGNSGGGTGYGFNGGAGSGNGAGGGGGASAVGQFGGQVTPGTAGNGGAGRNDWSTWLSATTLGVSGFIAGGGAGGYTIGGTGGSGGGGNGGSYGGTTSGTVGTINTGSGGGGSSAATAIAGAAGGSGLVIIRYTIA
jgi:hypothetical protein